MSRDTETYMVTAESDSEIEVVAVSVDDVVGRLEAVVWSSDLILMSWAHRGEENGSTCRQCNRVLELTLLDCQWVQLE